MKEKILAQLVTKYPGVSKKFLGLYASKLEAKVTEESEIEGVLNELDNLPISIPDLAAEFQKEGDNRVTVAKKEWLKTPPKPDAPPKTDPPAQDPPADDTPAWVKAILDSNKALTDKVLAIEKKEAVQTIQQRIKSNEKLKGVPEPILALIPAPEKEEDIDGYVEKVSTAWEQVKPAGIQTTRVAGGSGGTAKPKQTKEELDALIGKI